MNIYHQLIPKCMATWNLTKAVEVAEMKLATMERISDEMMTLLPSTLLELYEMYSLAKVQSIALHELNIMEYFLSIAFMFFFVFAGVES